MTSPSAGIQQLLAAEKKAADKIGEARKRKEIVNSALKLWIVTEKRCHVMMIILFMQF